MEETCVFSRVEPPGFPFLYNWGWHAQAEALTIRLKLNFYPYYGPMYVKQEGKGCFFFVLF